MSGERHGRLLALVFLVLALNVAAFLQRSVPRLPKMPGFLVSKPVLRGCGWERGEATRALLVAEQA